MSSINALRPLVISGPSGTGKSTLLKRLFEEYPDRFSFSISRQFFSSSGVCVRALGSTATAASGVMPTNATCLTVRYPVDTTRKPRPHEVHGKDYHFVERSEFEKMIEENGFVEHAQFSGNRYGTSRKALDDIQSTGRRPILDIDAQVRNQNFHLR